MAKHAREKAARKFSGITIFSLISLVTSTSIALTLGGVPEESHNLYVPSEVQAEPSITTSSHVRIAPENSDFEQNVQSIKNSLKAQLEVAQTSLEKSRDLVSFDALYGLENATKAANNALKTSSEALLKDATLSLDAALASFEASLLNVSPPVTAAPPPAAPPPAPKAPAAPKEEVAPRAPAAPPAPKVASEEPAPAVVVAAPVAPAPEVAPPLSGDALIIANLEGHLHSIGVYDVKVSLDWAGNCLGIPDLGPTIIQGCANTSSHYDIYFKPLSVQDSKSKEVRSLMLHEYAHLIQFRVGYQTIVDVTDPIFGVGRGIEESADCIAVLLGAASRSGGYTDDCSGARGVIAADILEGRVAPKIEIVLSPS